MAGQPNPPNVSPPRNSRPYDQGLLTMVSLNKAGYKTHISEGSTWPGGVGGWLTSHEMSLTFPLTSGIFPKYLGKPISHKGTHEDP